MVMDAVLERFIEQSPVTVMARLALQRALEPVWIDGLFERHRQTQYTRELLFSTTVDLMSVVAMGLRPSLHSAIRAMPDLPVSMQAVYDKIRHTEPDVIRALVQGSAQRLGALMESVREEAFPTTRGYHLRIIDGNHLPASEKRLKPLRAYRGAALPGQSLVIYEPGSNLVVDIVPGEDAHASERSLMAPVLAHAQPGQLWIADRHFSTHGMLAGWQARGCGFIVREHSLTPHPSPLDPPKFAGRIETGSVQEQTVALEGAPGQWLTWRRIELRLDTPTTDGDEVIRILTNLPEADFDAREVMTLYRRRWRIENLFQRLESVLHSEVTSLGHPRAALLAFGVSVLAWNVLAVLDEAVRTAHDLKKDNLALSAFHVATEVRAQYAGMEIAVEDAVWAAYDAMSLSQLGQALREIATQVNPRQLCTSPRGPKKPKDKPFVQRKQAAHHVSTHRVLKLGRIY